MTETWGRPPRLVTAEIVRELDESDLARLGEDRGVRTPTLRRLTDMHHSIARLIAQGEAGYAIAMATGYSESRISILKADPAFQELVSVYRDKVEEVRDAAFVDVTKKMGAVLVDAVESMHDDLLDGIPLSPKDKVEYARFCADRIGYGPTAKQQNTNFTFSLADALAEGRQRADELSAAVPAARANRGLLASPRLAEGATRPAINQEPDARGAPQSTEGEE